MASCFGNARAMGEFGAVSVVSGHIRRDQHHAAPYRDFVQRISVAAAFAVASPLVMLALVTLVLDTALERNRQRESLYEY